MYTILTLPLLFACWQGPEREQFQRGEEMVDHRLDLLRVRDAVLAEDLERMRTAGRALAKDDWFPGLDAAGNADLRAVREHGATLSQAKDLDTAATTLVALTGTCATCHQRLAIPAPDARTSDATGPLWIALLWESEDHWSAGKDSLPGLGEAREWADRRAAVATALGANPD